MHAESRGPRAEKGSGLQRAIVLALLRDDREPRWSREELAKELDVDAEPLEQAIGELEADGVVRLDAGELCAARAATRLDQLDLIAI